MSLLSCKPIFGVLMLICFARSLSAQTYRNMSSLAGITSVAYVTVPSQEVAKKLAHGLVKNKLAACVNIIPGVISVYEWKNEMNEDNELLMMIKTRTDTVDALTKYVKENHPYEVCEVISLPIQNGNEEYIQWVSNITDKKSSIK
ncbi:PREDICTED: divalent-cation tolerance protein CutA [Dufourea novaeangliae]|uniref:Protein CutA like protein n=1 Tax=Dufourea novaeangliae TaxID=178035 RepID=A0A154PIX4_DUFNO|nr:PREDICTED: divalent-cation tolerance protein CutA [Dufourea novaeangliae]KZC11836.1 Protein CutA like protein [Dufourea novaeangliae]